MSKKDEPDFYALDKTNRLPGLYDAPIPGIANVAGGIRNLKLQRDSNLGLAPVPAAPRLLPLVAGAAGQMNAMPPVTAMAPSGMLQRYGTQDVDPLTSSQLNQTASHAALTASMGAQMNSAAAAAAAMLPSAPNGMSAAAAGLTTGGFGSPYSMSPLRPQATALVVTQPAMIQMQQQQQAQFDQMQNVLNGATSAASGFDQSSANLFGGAGAFGGPILPSGVSTTAAAMLGFPGTAAVATTAEDPSSFFMRRRTYVGVE